MQKKGSEFDYRNINEIFHSRIRLAIVATLASCQTADFNFLKSNVNTTDGNLSVHLKKLEDNQYLRVKKKFIDNKPRTFYTLTSRGRKDFQAYIDSLRVFIDRGFDEK